MHVGRVEYSYGLCGRYKLKSPKLTRGPRHGGMQLRSIVGRVVVHPFCHCVILKPRSPLVDVQLVPSPVPPIILLYLVLSNWKPSYSSPGYGMCHKPSTRKTVVMGDISILYRISVRFFNIENIDIFV